MVALNGEPDNNRDVQDSRSGRRGQGGAGRPADKPFITGGQSAVFVQMRRNYSPVSAVLLELFSLIPNILRNVAEQRRDQFNLGGFNG